MKSKGIRILDKINKVVSVDLPDILREILCGNSLSWSILYIYAQGDLGDQMTIEELEYQVNKSEKGFFISWEDLNQLASKFYQVYDIIIIGSNDVKHLHRYDDDQEMYETCEIVIHMVDSNFWEVFSKDKDLIKRLAAKFKNIKFLEPNFHSKQV